MIFLILRHIGKCPDDFDSLCVFDIKPFMLFHRFGMCHQLIMFIPLNQLIQFLFRPISIINHIFLLVIQLMINGDNSIQLLILILDFND